MTYYEYTAIVAFIIAALAFSIAICLTPASDYEENADE